jgi:hypothetical protein
MKASTLSLVVALAFAGPLRVHDKLDLDIYSFDVPARAPGDAAGSPLRGWVPGDARDERGQPVWVKHLSHVGYAGLGAAGLAAGVASGGVAPAVGFGLVTLVQSYLEWRQARE